MARNALRSCSARLSRNPVAEATAAARSVNGAPSVAANYPPAMVSTDDSEVPPYPDLLRLDGRGFIVLGAGVGIGRQAAHALASVGARVFCIDNVESLAQEVAEEVGGVPWVADARKREDVEGAVAAAEKELGRIHGAVDIVGMAR